MGWKRLHKAYIVLAVFVLLLILGYSTLGNLMGMEVLKTCIHEGNTLTDFGNLVSNWNVITGRSEGTFQEEQGSLIVNGEAKFCRNISLLNCRIKYAQTMLYFVAMVKAYVNFSRVMLIMF
jgi:hypothetical protein